MRAAAKPGVNRITGSFWASHPTHGSRRFHTNEYGARNGRALAGPVGGGVFDGADRPPGLPLLFQEIRINIAENLIPILQRTEIMLCIGRDAVMARRKDNFPVANQFRHFLQAERRKNCYMFPL
jgi:hypothetical protein